MTKGKSYYYPVHYYADGSVDLALSSTENNENDNEAASNAGADTTETHLKTTYTPCKTLLVKDVNGRRLRLSVHHSWTIEVIKKMIEVVLSIPPQQQALEFGGRELDDTWTLSDCCISDEATVRAVFWEEDTSPEWKEPRSEEETPTQTQLLTRASLLVLHSSQVLDFHITAAQDTHMAQNQEAKSMSTSLTISPTGECMLESWEEKSCNQSPPLPPMTPETVEVVLLDQSKFNMPPPYQVEVSHNAPFETGYCALWVQAHPDEKYGYDEHVARREAYATAHNILGQSINATTVKIMLELQGTRMAHNEVG